MAARGPSPQLDALGRSLALRHVLVSAMPPMGSRPSGGAPAAVHAQASSMDRDTSECHVSSSTTRPFSATKRMCVPQARPWFQDCLVLVAMPLPVRLAARRDRAKPVPPWARPRPPAASMRLVGRSCIRTLPRAQLSGTIMLQRLLALSNAKGANSRMTGIRTQLAPAGDHLHAARRRSLQRACVISNLTCFLALAQRLQLLKHISSEGRS